ncbi:uncharacterized protein BO80DRAFT_463733 [Aspergillus ibericus CBS 121593]|uniref:Secreted protein n=1 Tax=Aspergillus ibericus CBS 121593 TaxID=1448316 RepID=A0A395H2D5_9EURO|nr:hypothetical protein BO80DRAFT_463733 [Aspergillus ibericus CBS 121593]RAL02047.1 hypothetical protein BO80DRAFT_463733 [Aspergillus ibericus CBS 121593]
MPNRFSLIIATILAFMLTAASQISNPKTNTLICSKPGGSYCVYGSLKNSVIISCASKNTVEIRSCNLLLSNILPEGYEEQAICYESTPPTGDAVCAFRCTGYTLPLATVPVPESILCDEAGLWDQYPNTPDVNSHPTLTSTTSSHTYYAISPHESNQFNGYGDDSEDFIDLYFNDLSYSEPELELESEFGDDDYG